MSDFVYLRVSDLEKLVLDLKHHQLDAASIFIDDPFEDEGDQVPASLCVSGVNSVRPGFSVDMDELYSDPEVEKLFSGISHTIST